MNGSDMKKIAKISGCKQFLLVGQDDERVHITKFNVSTVEALGLTRTLDIDIHRSVNHILNKIDEGEYDEKEYYGAG